MNKILAQVGFPGGLDIGLPPNTAFTNETTFVAHIQNWLLLLAAVVAVAAVIYSGFMYITSAGDSDQAEKAKKNLTWAIIGVVLVAFSAVLVTWIDRVLNQLTP
jgi:hypothetical protein